MLFRSLLTVISAHPKWQQVAFIQPPQFVVAANHPLGLSGLVFCEVQDSHASSTAKSLLKSNVPLLVWNTARALGPLPRLRLSVECAVTGVIIPMHASPSALGVPPVGVAPDLCWIYLIFGHSQ